MTSLLIRAPAAWLGPGRVTRDVQVLCRGAEIEAVGPPTAVPDDVEVVEARGFLMPAAADRHVHIELSDPASVLKRGVTAVRDLAWPPHRIFPRLNMQGKFPDRVHTRYDAGRGGFRVHVLQDFRQRRTVPG